LYSEGEQPDTEARTEIHAAMAKLANWMRNREG